MTADPADGLRQAAEWIRAGTHVVALTGAGISVDSGIPDFRSPGGLWDRFDPMEYATIDAFLAHPEKVWQMIRAMSDLLESARPNPGHLALARLEEMGRLAAVITQNIDNLHQDAGNRQVIEFHGNGRYVICLDCGMRLSTDRLPREPFPPRCPCGDGRRVLKPDVVFFGEMIPPAAGARAQREAESCDVMIVAGTSAVVAPASYLPVIARRAGAKVIEVNRESTVLTGRIADLSLRGGTSELLPRLVELVAA